MLFERQISEKGVTCELQITSHTFLTLITSSLQLLISLVSQGYTMPVKFVETPICCFLCIPSMLIAEAKMVYSFSIQHCV